MLPPDSVAARLLTIMMRGPVTSDVYSELDIPRKRFHQYIKILVNHGRDNGYIIITERIGGQSNRSTFTYKKTGAVGKVAG